MLFSKLQNQNDDKDLGKSHPSLTKKYVVTLTKMMKKIRDLTDFSLAF